MADGFIEARVKDYDAVLPYYSAGFQTFNDLDDYIIRLLSIVLEVYSIEEANFNGETKYKAPVVPT